MDDFGIQSEGQGLICGAVISHILFFAKRFGLCPHQLTKMHHRVDKMFHTPRPVFLFALFGFLLITACGGEGDTPSRMELSGDVLTDEAAQDTANDLGSDDGDESQVMADEEAEDKTGAEVVEAEEASDTSDTSLLTFMPLAESGDVVSYVELDRYLGTWYEIATTPSFQQAACSNTQAEYTYNEAEGWVDVVNSCSAGGPDGRVQQIRGRAELVDTDTQAKLEVVFFNQRSPYWVVALDGREGTEPYQWAVVSVPGSQTIWILSRTPEISEAERQEINNYLESRSFPIERLIDTTQVR